MVTNNPTGTTGPKKNLNFYKVKEGKIVQFLGRVKPEEETTNLKITPDKTGVPFYEFEFKNITGIIDKIIIWEDETKDGLKNWEMLSIYFTCSEVLSIYRNSRYANDFLKRIVSCNLLEEITVQPYKFITLDKISEGVTVLQHNVKKPFAFTKDKRGNLPEMKKVLFKGKEQWDNTEQKTFLDSLVNIINDYLRNPTEDKKTDLYSFCGIEVKDFSNDTLPF